MILGAFDSSDPAHIAVLASIWNDACGHALAITPQFAAYNTRPPAGAVQAGRLAMQNDPTGTLRSQPVGFVLASALSSDPLRPMSRCPARGRGIGDLRQTSPPQTGWIDAIAVSSIAQRRGIGSALLAWAEEWLSMQGCTHFRLGGSLHPFAPGYPVELANAAFFLKRGYAARAGEPQVCDLARDLSDWKPTLRTTRSDSITIRPAQRGDELAIRQFFKREFPDRWRFEFEEFVRERGRWSDYIVLFTERGVDGFARLTFENSERPIERFYPQRLPRPWGQLGPLGVSKDARGKGYGGALLDAALGYLRDRGVRGCVIDWTGLVDLYGKFGFKPYRWYAMMLKAI